MTTKKRVVLVLGSLFLLLTLTAGGCDDEAPTAERQDRESLEDEIEQIRINMGGVETMEGYSPTFETVNEWVRTWRVPGTLAFTYITNENGDVIDYFIFEGPPVNICVSLKAPYTFVDSPNDGTDDIQVLVPAPSTDGLFYSGGGCFESYGKDAVTGALIHFTVGGTQNYRASTQPLPRFIDARPTGPTQLADITQRPDGTYEVAAG